AGEPRHHRVAVDPHPRGRPGVVPAGRHHRPGADHGHRKHGRATRSGGERAGKPRRPVPEADRRSGVQRADRAPPGLSGLAATRTILGAEALALRHRLLKRGPARLVLLAVALGAAAVFIGGGAFTVGATAGRYLPTAVDAVLVGGFTGLSVLMLVVGFPTVIATFFVGRDLLQLALAPVRTIEIFAARLTLA